MLGPALFVGALRPDYNHLTDAVSELGARGAPTATAWNLIGFIAVGLLILAFSWGLFLRTGSLAALVFVGLSGLAFAGTGVFPADMADLTTAGSRAHIVMSLISFAAFVLGAFLLCWRLQRVPGWRVAAVYSGILGLLAVLTMPLREMAVPAGLAQRAGFVVYLAWIALLAAVLWRRAQT